MRVIIEARELPGRRFGEHENVQVAVQVGRDPVGPVPGDAPSARWQVDVRLSDGDWRGDAIHGKRGERFLYLTWGDPAGEDWRMFRRIKLMASDVDPALTREAERTDRPLVARLTLTDEKGGPRCARVSPTWSVGA